MKSEAKRHTVRHSKSAKMTEQQKQVVCKGVAEVLVAAYPRYRWAVSMNHRMVNITNLDLSGKWGFTLDMGKVDADNKKIIMAAGEILERYNMSRGWADQDAIANAKRDFTGAMIHHE